MQVIIQPSKISGTIQAPASKSSMQRACAAALLRKGESIIKNPGRSNDDRAALNVIQQMGAKIKFVNEELLVVSEGVVAVNNTVNCGESGLGIRMFAPIISLSDHQITISGEGSLLNRPMDFFDEVFPQLGIDVISNNGKLPLKIKGPLKPKSITIDGSLSSQFLTGLLMAYSAADAKDVSIKVRNLKSRPYIDLTLQVMEQFGLKMPVNKNYEEFYFPGSDFDSAPSTPLRTVSTSDFDSAQSDLSGPSTALRTGPTPDSGLPTPECRLSYTVEGDWSGGAFLLVAGAIAGKIEVLGLQNTSTQADKKIVDALLDAGAEVIVSDDKVFVNKNNLEPFEFDATDCPDLFPPLVSLAAHCNGITRIRGLRRLKYKESDRGVALKEEFDKLSTQIDLHDDEMLVYGSGGIFVKNHTLNSHHDHRIAMACAVACLGADFEVQIRNAEAVNKSYPTFYEHLKNLGAVINVQESSLNIHK